MSSSRQLAAIMFTDIVGYTALMGEDEQKAFDLLRKNRQLQKPIIEKFNGTWIKEIGDGVLASFHTVTDAVMCSIEIQKACNDIDDLKLRIGIHLGEVVFEDNDVFGDGVNIASRLQALAPIGGIWISEAVYKNVSNKKKIKTKFVSEEILKNVKEPVRVYEVKPEDFETYESAVTVPAASVIRKQELRKKQKRLMPVIIFLSVIIVLGLGYYINTIFQKTERDIGKKNSIAVLYFENMSGDSQQEYFSDGITEEIITHLANIKALRVISRTSVLTYKGKPVNLKKIADELDVSSVLEGSVRKSGNTLRINADLIDARTDKHLGRSPLTGH